MPSLWQRSCKIQLETCNFTPKSKQILFLHGYLSFGKSFVNQLDFLSRDFEVFAPDLKGFGQNSFMPYPYSLDEYIIDVKEYMYKHGLKSPNVVAHSFGGRIVLKGVATKKLKFSKLVLTGCAGLKRRPSVIKGTKKVTFKILRCFMDREKLKAFYSKEYLSLSPVMRESFKLITEEKLDCYLSQIKNPTLIINGSLDKDVPIYQAKRLNKGITGSSLSIYKGAGHFCFLDKPYKFNTEVKEFLLS